MFELILIVGAVIGMARMAESDRGEGFKWGAITFGLCLFSLLIPLPALRILIAIVVSFVWMTVSEKKYY